MQKPCEPLFESNDHTQDDILNALKAPDGLVGKLPTLLGIGTTAIERVGQRGQRQARNKQASPIEGCGHDAKPVMFRTQDSGVWHLDLIEGNSACGGLHPHLLAVHLLIMHMWIIHGYYKAGRAMSTGALGVGHGMH